MYKQPRQHSSLLWHCKAPCGWTSSCVPRHQPDNAQASCTHKLYAQASSDYQPCTRASSIGVASTVSEASSVGVLGIHRPLCSHAALSSPSIADSQRHKLKQQPSKAAVPSVTTSPGPPSSQQTHCHDTMKQHNICLSGVPAAAACLYKMVQAGMHHTSQQHKAHTTSNASCADARG